MTNFFRRVGLGVVLAAFGTMALAAETPIRIGIVSFLSGPAAGPFGIPGRNGAELLAEQLNAGNRLPAPYRSAAGFGGAPLELVYLDEAGGTAKQVTEYRNLVQRQGVDLVIGYIASGDCLAVAPVAEELRKLTVFFDCGTPRLFEDQSYRYVFRTCAHAVMDNVSAALYVAEQQPTLATVGAINQNYAWGQDSWSDFEAALRALRPDLRVVSSQMPKLFAGQYGAEITTLLNARPDVVHSSMWGGDLEAFLVQSVPRGLFRRSQIILTTGEHLMFRGTGTPIPDGTIIGGRGLHGAFAPNNELNRWFAAAYRTKYGNTPNYVAYQMAQSILGVKAAWEKAQAKNGGRRPSQEQVIAAFEYLQWETPSGTVRLSLGNGHQAVQDTAVGRVKRSGGQIGVTEVKHYPAERVNPPAGEKSMDWIRRGGFLRR